MQKYTIDPEYKALLPPQTEDERKALEESILADGCRDALIVDETNTIIDGHNRYEICTKHNIPFNVVVRHFDSRDDIIVFICRNQIGRRNLSPDTLSYVIGLMYNLEKKKHGGDRGNKHTKLPTAQNEQLQGNEDTSDKIAKETGVSRATVVRAGQFASAVDALSENEPSVKAAILSGKSGLTRKSVVEIAAMDEEKKKAAVDKIKAGEGRKVVDGMMAKRICKKCGTEMDEEECKKSKNRVCRKCNALDKMLHYEFGDKEEILRAKKTMELAEQINLRMRDVNNTKPITLQDAIEKMEFVVSTFSEQIKCIANDYLNEMKESPKEIEAVLLAAETAIKEVKEFIYE